MAARFDVLEDVIADIKNSFIEMEDYNIEPYYFQNRQTKLLKLNNNMRVVLVSDKDVSLASYSIEINYGGLGF